MPADKNVLVAADTNGGKDLRPRMRRVLRRMLPCAIGREFGSIRAVH
jgi:hypothetical protein